jgi:transposase
LVLVAVLGASSYTYTDATWSKTLPDWIALSRQPRLS